MKDIVLIPIRDLPHLPHRCYNDIVEWCNENGIEFSYHGVLLSERDENHQNAMIWKVKDPDDLILFTLRWLS